MSVPNTGGLHVERNLASSDFCSLEKQGVVCSYFSSLIGPVIEVGSGIFTIASVSSGFLEGETDSEVLIAAVSEREIDVLFWYKCII